MPIISFTINELPVKHAECQGLPNLMIIAGPNGVGKSSLLDSLAKNMRENKSNVEKTPKAKPVHILAHRVPAPQKLHKSTVYTTKDTRFQDSLSGESYRFRSAINPNEYLQHSSVRNRTSPDFASYFEVKNKLVRFESKFNEAIKEIYVKNGEVRKDSLPDIFKPIREAVSNLLPGITFDKVELVDENFDVKFTNRLGSNVEFDSLSSGEKDILAMLFPLLEKQVENLLLAAKGETSPKEDLVILIDTPEANLHPALQEIFLKYIRSSIKQAIKNGELLQFILVTHSPVMINAAEPSELFLMNFPEQDENQLIKTEDLDLSALQSYLGRLGLSAFTFGKPILLLEGKTDSDLLYILKPDLTKKFVLYHVGGKERVTGFIETFDKLIDELSQRRIHIFGILDKDREDKIKSKSVKLQASLFTLPVTCMENLLLNSEYIFEALKISAGNEKLTSANILTPSDINNLKEKIIQESSFLNEELHIRLNEELSFNVNIDDISPIEYSTVKSKIEKIYETKNLKIKSIIENQTKEVTEYISNKNYSFLNGKIILNHIAQKFGLDKDLLARNIADQMQEKNFVPEPLETILNKFPKGF